jgi:hypothetical protein
MAVNETLSVIALGSRRNEKQSILMIPAKAEADKPGLLDLQDVDDSGVVGDHYLWVDHSGNLRMHTSVPTDQDSDGSAFLTSASLSLDGAFDNGKIIDGASSSGTAMKVGGAATNDKIAFYHDGSNPYIAALADDLIITAAGGDISFDDENLTTTGAVTCQGIVNTATAIDTTAQLQVGADNVKITLGASDDTDSYMLFDGSGNLTFYDSAYGSTVTLSQLAGTSPTFSGDLTLSDGKIIWTDSSDEVAGAWSFSGTTNDDIDWTSSVTTANAIDLNCSAMTTGSGVKVSATEATLTSGKYFEAYDLTGTATVFAVKEDGEVEITGAAGSDMLTITAGNLQLDNGKFEVDTTQDIISYVARNHATSTNPVMQIKQDHTGATGACLLLTQDATGNAPTLDIDSAGDYPVIDIDAPAARTGNVIDILMTNQVAETAIDISGAATGTSGEGIVHIDITGALAGGGFQIDSTGANANTGHLFYGKSTGNIAGATNGAIAYFEETGNAQATTYAVYIASTNNEALKVDTGQSVFDEKVTISNTDNIGQDVLLVDQNDSTQNKDAIVATCAGTGKVLSATVETATGGGAHFIGAASQTTSLVTIDGTTGDWLGAQDVGMLHLHTDGTAAHTDTSMLYLDHNGTSASGQLGVAVHIDTAGVTSGGGTEYAAYINAGANIEALKVDTGTVVVDETVKASGGIFTNVDTTDVSNPPTDAELDAAIGDAATAAFGAGYMAIVDDAGGHANEYIVFSDGTKWWQVTATACS